RAPGRCGDLPRQRARCRARRHEARRAARDPDAARRCGGAARAAATRRAGPVSGELTGVTVVVTRPAHQAAPFAALLAAQGAHVVGFPSLAIEALPLGAP